MIIKFLHLTTLLAVALLLIACNNGLSQPAKTNKNGVRSLKPEFLKKLASKRIYFGHMSVGNNIIQGVQEVAQSYPDLPLAIRETEDFASFGQGLFAHSRIGDNKQPLKKVHNFSEKMDAGLGNQAEVAFFKFCYIDIMANQDTDQVLAAYQQTMSNLKHKYPNTTFVHVTVPLTVVQTGWKVPIKKLLGKAPGGYLDNIMRNRFNQKLLTTYAGKEPVFDLARVEATRPNGSMATFEWEGKTYLGMHRDYASDGRHLNEQGRRYAAEQLLVFLANI